MLEYQEELINNEADHIENFCAGFESIISQYLNKGTQVEIGGCEAYTTTIMKANNLNWDATQGLEGFLGDGIKKIYEMIKNFFKGIWNFFFGPSKAAQTAKNDADEISEILKDSGFRSSLDESLKNSNLSFDLAMNKAKTKTTTLDQLESDLKKDREASKMIDNAAIRIDNMFSFGTKAKGDTKGKYADELSNFNSTLNDLLGTGYSFPTYKKLLEGFGKLAQESISLKYQSTRAESIITITKIGKDTLGLAENALKELERSVEAVRHKAEKEKTRDTEYKAQQALRLINMAIRRVAHIMTVFAKNLKIIKEQMKIIKDINVFG